MKLHLGCGQRYLEGYVNIDYPPSSHTVQEGSIADLHADILTLRYAHETIEEIRLHHVFEHFPRPVACALLSCWHFWMKPKGILHIEVPDFQKTGRVLLNPFASFNKKAIAERHIFGSHEAGWAVHCEGYTISMMKKMISCYGFKVNEIRKNSWMGTFNFELFAKKSTENITKKDFEAVTEKYLRNYLVDDGETETQLLKVWIETYKDQIEKSWALDE